MKTPMILHSTSLQEEATETWRAADSPHIVDTRSVMYSDLKIEPCAYVLVEHGGSFNVARGGNLVARGTADQPIVFERLEDDLPWGQISTAYQASNGEADDELGGRVDLAYVTLTGGGGAGSSDESPVISIRGNDYQFENLAPVGHVKVSHVTIDGGDVGVALVQGGTFSEGSSDLTIKNVAGTPFEASFRALGTLPTGTYTGNGVDVIQVTNEVRQTRDLTIHDLGVPYRMSVDFRPDDFTMSATLTIEDGVTLAFTKDQGLQIDDDGALIARGQITFTSAQRSPAPGDWSGIAFRGKPRAENVIDGATVEYAGGDDDAIGRRCDPSAPTSPQSGHGAVSFDTVPTTAFVKNTTIRDSLHDGFNRGWKGTPLDLSATNTISRVGGCKQSFPEPVTGGCPDPVPCD